MKKTDWKEIAKQISYWVLFAIGVIAILAFLFR
jgi:hypothetical protein